MQFLRAFSFLVLVAVLAACDQTAKGCAGPTGPTWRKRRDRSTGTSRPRRSFSCACRSDDFTCV